MTTPEDQEQSLPQVQVVVRVRPCFDDETSCLSCGSGLVRLNGEGEELKDSIADRDCRRVRRPQEFRFSTVFGPSSNQEEVFSDLQMEQLISKVVEGYHATVFAYGQTGSGKTYTMEGYQYRAQTDSPQVCIDETAPERLGVIPRALRQLFAKIEHSEESTEDRPDSFSVRISFLQIYQEKIYDLLNPAPFLQGVGTDEGLRLRWDAVRDCFFVENLFEYQCASADDALRYYHAGVQRKQMASTAMNIASSRSHSVLILSLLRRSQLLGEGVEGGIAEVTSNLTLVDLAGSEKAAANENNAERFKEAVNINQSLFVLRRVITALSRNADEHVPYRESKLTSLLQHAIGGKGFMIMLACLAPADKYYEDNLSTLQYAAQAALIRGEPVINLDPKDRLIAELTQQLHAAHDYILQQMGLKELPEELQQIPSTKGRNGLSIGRCSFPSRRDQDRGQKERCRIPIPRPRPDSTRDTTPADAFQKSASTSELCQETSQSADPERRRKRLPRTYSWDTRRDPRLQLEKQLKEAEAETQQLEEQLQEALRRRHSAKSFRL